MALHNSISKNKEWFVEYTPFETIALFSIPYGELRALGVGVVEIPVKLQPNTSGPESHGRLRLYDVLYCSGSEYNIIGIPYNGEYSRINFKELPDGSHGELQDSSGRRVACLAEGPLCTLDIHRPQLEFVVGQSTIKSKYIYFISAQWMPSERQRWLEYWSGLEHSPALPGSGEPPKAESSEVDDDIVDRRAENSTEGLSRFKKDV